MKAIVNTGPGRLEMLEVPAPEPASGQVRIRTLACGICATDLEIIAGWDRTSFPCVPGHEWCGIVDMAGPQVEGARVGAMCVGENVLSDGGEVGFEHPGGYAQYFVTEAANLHALPPGFPPDVAALIEPLAVCVRGLRRLRFEDKTAALVLGDGPIGLVMLMLLKRAGVESVYLAGGRAARLALARDLGAAETLDYHACGNNLAAAVSLAARDRQFRTIVEASGSASAIQTALRLAAPGAKVLVLGDYADTRARFPWNALLHREWELIGSSASAAAWPEAVAIAQEPSFPLSRLVTHRFPAARFNEAFDLVQSRSGGVIKVVLTWTS